MSLSIFGHVLHEHVASMAVANKVVQDVRGVFDEEVIDAPPMMYVETPTEFSFSNSAELAAVLIALTGKPTAQSPRRAIVLVIAAAPQRALFSVACHRKMLTATCAGAGFVLITSGLLKLLATDNAFGAEFVVRPAPAKVTLRRAVLSIGTACGRIELFPTHSTGFRDALLSAWARIAFAFVPRRMTFRGTGHRAVFPLAMISGKSVAASLTNESDHEDLPYWPYSSKCGKAVRQAFRTVHEAVLSHALLYRKTGELQGRAPLFVDDAPAPRAEQMRLGIEGDD